MEFGVFGEQAVGFVIGGGLRGERLADDVAEAGVLEEMAAEGVARRVPGFVAAGNPRAAFEQVVALVESGRRKVCLLYTSPSPRD